MVELQRVRVRCQDVFCRITSFPSRRCHSHARIPRACTHVPTELHPRAVGGVRDVVRGSIEFHQGIYSDLNAVRDAFDKSLQYDVVPVDEWPRRASDGCAEGSSSRSSELLRLR